MAAKEDPNLAEVKAVLKQLQRLDLSSPDGDTKAVVQPANAKAGEIPRPDRSRTTPSVAVFERKLAAVRVSQSNTSSRFRTYSVIALATGGLAVGSLAGIAYLSLNKRTGHELTRERNGPEALNTAARQIAPAMPPARIKEDDAKLIAEARRLLLEGDTVAARRRLQEGEPDKLAEIAFILAQSYDPNYLRTLSKVNAKADRVQAERWYRKWYELALGSGLEMDSGRLQRIINAMQ